MDPTAQAPFGQSPAVPAPENNLGAAPFSASQSTPVTSPPPWTPPAPEPPPFSPPPIHVPEPIADVPPPSNPLSQSPLSGFTSEPPHQSKMKYFLYGFLIVLLMTATGFGGYYLGTQKTQTQDTTEPVVQKPVIKSTPTPTPFATPTSTATSTTDWKQYISAPLAIAFRYPEKLGKQISAVSVYETNGAADTTALKADSEILISTSSEKLLSIYYYKSQLSAADWWKTEGITRFNKLVTDYNNSLVPKPTGAVKLPVFTVSATQIGGMNAAVARGNVDAGPNGGTVVVSIVSYNNVVYMFYQNNPLGSEAQTTGDLILSTVRFGSTVSTTDVTTSSSSATGVLLSCGGTLQTTCPTGYYCQQPAGSLSSAQGTCVKKTQ